MHVQEIKTYFYHMKTPFYYAHHIGVFVFLMIVPFITKGQHFVPSAKNSQVEFRVYNHKEGMNLVRGLFPDINGSIFFDPKHLATASFDVSVNPASISTANTRRDEDLVSANFLSAVHYPEIRIKSNSVTTDGGVIYMLHGTLVMKGITKPVNIQFTATPIKSGYLFRGSFQLNRLLYHVGEQGDIDNTVTVFIEIRTERG